MNTPVMNTLETPLAFFVDDNEHQRKLISCFAEFRPVVAAKLFASLEETIEALAESIPHLLYLDNQLHPHDNYYETVPVIRDAGYTGSIVVMSADVEPLRRDGARELAAQWGVVEFLDKAELQLGTFSALIHRHLSL
jgi:CheY-like chemotaxis protein